MKNHKKYHGVIIPMITPFDDQLRLDEKSIKYLIDFFIDSGTIPFILGTTGESVSMPQELQCEYVKSVAGTINGRSLLYVGIADTCFESSIHQAKKYVELGADVLVGHLPPYYPLDENQILSYFQHLADELPAPLMLYNIPATTKLSIPLPIVEQLSTHPNIIGLKDSERSVERIAQLASAYKNREDFSILSGWTVKSHFALDLGFDGIVPSTGNLLPELFADLFRAVCEGDKTKAEKLQAIIDPIADFHQKDKILSHVIAMLKVMMAEKGLCGPAVYPPLTRLGQENEELIRKEMRKFNINSLI